MDVKPARPERKSCGLLPQMESLPGSLHLEMKRCGRPSCRCARGELHGPYVYRHWWEQGRQRKQYVRDGDLERVQAALARWREEHPRAWEVRKAMQLLERLWREREGRGL